VTTYVFYFRRNKPRPLHPLLDRNSARRRMPVVFEVLASRVRSTVLTRRGEHEDVPSAFSVQTCGAATYSALATKFVRLSINGFTDDCTIGVSETGVSSPQTIERTPIKNTAVPATPSLCDIIFSPLAELC